MERVQKDRKEEGEENAENSHLSQKQSMNRKKEKKPRIIIADTWETFLNVHFLSLSSIHCRRVRSMARQE